jgi:putative addiction module component (TIGR02574 family)
VFGQRIAIKIKVLRGGHMNTAVSDVVKHASALSPAERVAVAEILLESVQTNDDLAVQAAWEAELKRRVSEVKNGSVTLISSEEVYAEARKLFK